MKTKEIMDVLNHLMTEDKLTATERGAISEACDYMARLEYNKGELTDFQGWPLEKLTMKHLRKFVRDNGALDDDVRLRILQDDGMGYGAVNGYCTDIEVDESLEDETKKEARFWF